MKGRKFIQKNFTGIQFKKHVIKIKSNINCKTYPLIIALNFIQN